jgi:hypothetical protein
MEHVMSFCDCYSVVCCPTDWVPVLCSSSSLFSFYSSAFSFSSCHTRTGILGPIPSLKVEMQLPLLWFANILLSPWIYNNLLPYEVLYGRFYAGGLSTVIYIFWYPPGYLYHEVKLLSCHSQYGHSWESCWWCNIFHNSSAFNPSLPVFYKMDLFWIQTVLYSCVSWIVLGLGLQNCACPPTSVELMKTTDMSVFILGLNIWDN